MELEDPTVELLHVRLEAVHSFLEPVHSFLEPVHAEGETVERAGDIVTELGEVLASGQSGGRTFGEMAHQDLSVVRAEDFGETYLKGLAR